MDLIVEGRQINMMIYSTTLKSLNFKQMSGIIHSTW